MTEHELREQLSRLLDRLRAYPELYLTLQLLIRRIAREGISG
jgi:hypothetical protein